MKEITEGGIVYEVSDSYPEAPYIKVAKTVPAKRKILTRFEFRSLFSFNELVAITTAAKSDTIIEVFMDSLKIAEEVDLTYPDTAQGLGYLVSQGLITQEKMDNILIGV